MSGRMRVLARGVTVALLVSVAWASPSPAQEIDEGARVAFARAELLMRSGDAEAALSHLERVVELLDRDGSPGETAELLLRRALLLQARAARETGDQEMTDAALDRLIEIDPAVQAGDVGLSEELRERYADRRQRKVGFLRVGLYPADATVLVDGERLEPLPELVPLLAGVHVVEARRPGYAPGREEVEIVRNRTEGVGFELERVSATVRLATRPPGALVSLDDEVIGRTVPAESGEASRSLLMEGLLPGSHELEVRLEGYRPFRQRIDVPRLTDYDLGTLVLERSVGIVVLRDLPAEAEVRVDGEVVVPERQVGGGGGRPAAGAARLSLPIGEHRVRASSPGGIWERRVTVADGATAGFDVRIRPGLAYLGLVGGDRMDRATVGDALTPALEALPDWFLLDRTGLAPGRVDGAEELARLRERARREAPEAVLYLLAEIPRGDSPEAFTVHLWAAPPGPDRPAALRVRLGEPGAAARALEPLREPLPGLVPWLGAGLIDSGLADGPVVAHVQPDSPAARAGLMAGDVLAGVDGAPVRSAAAVMRLVERAPRFSALTVSGSRNGEELSYRVTLDVGPRVAATEGGVPDPVLWAAATSELALREGAVPSWSLELVRALVLLRDGRPADAAGVLEEVTVPGGSPFGTGAVQYWLGVAHASGPTADLEAARRALERALENPDARLERADGPHVAPRARAWLARIRARENGGR